MGQGTFMMNQMHRRFAFSPVFSPFFLSLAGVGALAEGLEPHVLCVLFHRDQHPGVEAHPLT